MNPLVVVLEAVVVLGAIFLGVRMGGIGLGLWGAAGTAVLVFGFQLDPGSPPVDAFFIIIAVITASAAMQAAGGIDWLVMIASRIIQANPKRITLVAPLVSFVFTVGAGTSNIYFALIPVIHETAYRNGIRPEKPLASSTVTSALGITASPGLCGDGGLFDAPAQGLHPPGHSQDHHSSCDRVLHRDRARAAADRQGTVGGPGVSPAGRGGRA